MLSLQSCPALRPIDCSPPAPCPWGFSGQEYWSGLPFPPPGDLPDPGIRPASLMSPALQAGSLPLALPGILSIKHCARLQEMDPTSMALPHRSYSICSLLCTQSAYCIIQTYFSLWFLYFWVSFQHDTLPLSLTTRLAPQTGWAGYTWSQILPETYPEKQMWANEQAHRN